MDTILYSKLMKLDKKVDTFQSEVGDIYYHDIEVGSIASASGDDSSANNRARTDGYISIDEFWYCNTVDSTYRQMVFLYKSDKTYIGRLNTSFANLNVNRLLLNPVDYPTTAYIRIAFQRSDNGDMSETDIANLRQYICISNVTTRQTTEEIIRTEDAITEQSLNLNASIIGMNCVGVEIGSIDGTGAAVDGSTRCRTSDYISVDDFIQCVLPSNTYYMYCFLYDNSKDFIVRIPFDFVGTHINYYDLKTSYPEAKYIKLLFKQTRGNYTMYESDVVAIRSMIVLRSDVNRTDEAKTRFDKQFNYIAYSRLTSTENDAPINTAEHFYYCANDGHFTALKGDVRPTEDGKLVMCHDAGYTLNGSGKIIEYNASSQTLISTLTLAECKALTFAEQFDGQDCHPTDFETYVMICKKYGLIAFVTVRDEQIATVVAPEVMRILKLYRMTDRAIINSFTKATLETFRALDSTIMLSMVLTHNVAPTKDDVDYVYSLGNCLLNLFDVPLPSGSRSPVEVGLEELLSSSTYATVLEYAHSKNVLVYEAQTGNAATDVLIKHGIMGSHMYAKPIYDWKRT